MIQFRLLDTSGQLANLTFELRKTLVLTKYLLEKIGCYVFHVIYQIDLKPLVFKPFNSLMKLAAPSQTMLIVGADFIGQFQECFPDLLLRS